MEHPHVQATTQTQSQKFQVRATQMLKKVATIRTRLGGKIKQDTDDGPYKRQARSMDVQRTFMSQPVLTLQIPDTASPTDDNSSRSTSTSNSHAHPYSQIQKWDATLALAPMVKSESVPAKQRSIIINTPAHTVTDDQVMARVRTPIGVPDIIVSESRTPVDGIPHGDRPATRPLNDEANRPNMTLPAQPSRRSLKNSSQSIPRVNILPATSTTLPSVTATPGMYPRPRDLPSQTSSATSVSTHRPVLPRLKDIPPSAFVIGEDGSARLSPSIITRPPPMPILNLPTLPEPTPPPTQNPFSQPRARLRSIPALSVDGTSELDRESDHDNSALGDSDEEDDMEEGHSPGGSEDDDDDDTAPPSSQDSGSDNGRCPAAPVQRAGLPAIDMTPLGLSFMSSKTPLAGPSGSAVPPWRDPDATPIMSQTFDYFSVKSLPTPSETPRAAPAMLGSSTRPHTTGSRIALVPGLKRPVLFHHASKSMVDILSPKQTPAEPLPANVLDSKKSVGKGKTPARSDAFVSSPEYSQTESQGSALRRQRSMPIYNIASEPPPYPTFSPHPMSNAVVIQPRDDEGAESLPEYSNSIYLLAIMPRKMEFTAPGVQAKDRKWRRVICELDGTVFRVYKCPPRATGGGVIGEWWEKAVGVGDAASITSFASGSTIKLEQGKRTVERPSKLVEDALSAATSASTSTGISARSRKTSASQTHIAPKPKRLAASLLHPRSGLSPAQSRSHSRSQSDVPMSYSERRSQQSTADTLGDSRPPSRVNSSSTSFDRSTTVSIPSSRSSPPSSSSFLSVPSGRTSRNSSKRPSDVPIADPSDLMQAYSLQHAESGLGNDYLKRRNVIRVRMEGEQFLLQAHDVADVVEWIEGFHAATNIALDLDERAMPKGPMFPRRRRRRRRAGGGDSRPGENTI